MKDIIVYQMKHLKKYVIKNNDKDNLKKAILRGIEERLVSEKN